MKQDISLSELISFLKSEHILLDDLQIQQLSIYREEILQWSKRMNLISRGDQNYLLRRHFIASFYFLHYLLKEKNLSDCTILDLGSGAGFPGIILSIYLARSSIILLDSARKKTLFLKHMAEKLSLPSLILCERAEKLAQTTRLRFDIIVARAVASMTALIESSAGLLSPAGSLFTLKGQDYIKELKNYKLDQIIINELTPNKHWIQRSPELNNKVMLKMELKHVGTRFV